MSQEGGEVVSEKQRGTCDNDSHLHEFISPVSGMDGSGCKNWKPMSEKREQSAPPQFEFKTPLELIAFLRCTVNCGERLTDADNARIDSFIRSLEPVADPAPAAPRLKDFQFSKSLADKVEDGEVSIDSLCESEPMEAQGERCLDAKAALQQWESDTGSRASFTEANAFIDGFHDGVKAASVPATAERCPLADELELTDDFVSWLNDKEKGPFAGTILQKLWLKLTAPVPATALP